MSIFRRTWYLQLILVVVLSGCGSTALGFQGARPSATAPPVIPHVPKLKHVFVVVLENRSYNPKSPPYLAELRKQGALATHYFAIGHPSFPNYLALISGQTFGIDEDFVYPQLHAPTLVDQLEQKGLTWRGYIEALPGSCSTAHFGPQYAMRHNPFMYFSQIVNDPRRCGYVQPLTSLYSDLRSGNVPNFAWVTPNMCDDGHDCGDDAVDAFLRQLVPNITSSLAFKDHGALFITYDEGEDDSSGCCRMASGGRVVTLALGPGIRPGTTVRTPADHYSLLRTIEDGFRLKHLGGAGCSCTNTLGTAWRR
jgi:hypothetical protein